MKILFGTFLFLSVAFSAQANMGCRGYLNEDDVERIRKSRALIGNVDKRSLQRMVDDLEANGCPPMNAVIFEAIARTHDDIVREQKIVDARKEEFLYSKIKLNMAFLQLTGGQHHGDGDPLNRMIRFKLKQYLTEDVLTDPRFFHKVEELLE